MKAHLIKTVFVAFSSAMKYAYSTVKFQLMTYQCCLQLRCVWVFSPDCRSEDWDRLSWLLETFYLDAVMQKCAITLTVTVSHSMKNRRDIKFWRLNCRCLPPETAAFKSRVLYKHNHSWLLLSIFTLLLEQPPVHICIWNNKVNKYSMSREGFYLLYVQQK